VGLRALVTLGTGSAGTGVVLREGGSALVDSSVVQKAAPAAWQMAIQQLTRVAC
jgi:hypothetical protein